MSETKDQAAPAGEVAALQAELERERARAREVDHRAKNSLQLVSSLLLLLSRRSKETETQRALKAMHQRVGAIATVHRDILGAERIDEVDLTQLIRDHVATLTRQHGGDATVRLDLDMVMAPTSKACALALLVNELVLNALLHGSATRAGQVSVSLRKLDPGFILAVQDDGPGLAADAQGAGFGLTMVRLLGQQLGAQVAFEDAQPGVRAVVTAG